MKSLSKNSRKAFTLAEVLIAKRERGKMNLFNLSRTRELKAPSNKFMKQCAFTLAEVLITLGIIGVVAAMTIPILVSNSQKQETITGLKKSFTTIANAARLSEADNGEMSTWSVAAEWDGSEQPKFWNTYIIPYLKVAQNCNLSHTGCWAETPRGIDGNLYTPNDGYNYLTLSDGSTAFLNGVTFSYGLIDVDINGLKKPNKRGIDIFSFVLDYPHGQLKMTGSQYSRGSILGNFGGSCNKTSGNSGVWCGALIQQDGWQIKSDYPWD